MMHTEGGEQKVLKGISAVQEWEMHMERGTVSQLKAPGGAQQPGKKAVKTLEELAAADDMVDL